MNSSYYHPLKSGTGASETSFRLNFAAFLIGLAFLLVCRFYDYSDDTTGLFIWFALIVTASTAILEFFFYPKTSALRKWKILRPACWTRIFYKELALLFTFGVIGFFYWLFPIFRYNDFTWKYFPFLKEVLPYIVAGSLPYFWLMDKIDPETEDVYYKIGFGLAHFKKTVSGFELGNYVRSWLVKAFWLSLMQPAMADKIGWLINYDLDYMKDNPVEVFWTLNVACFFIDLAYASVGYLMNLKILNSQTRTAEPTLFGWFVAVMCYWPFWGMLFYPNFFAYETSNWLNLLQTGSFFWWFCFVSIILLEFLYAMATVSAGIRFSNLTYRGLWNTGLYRYTKHPAYVFKNISWWLISLPFLRENASSAIRCCVFLAGVNLIYYLRAKTEERHLSHYPEYEAYALEMNEKSIFRGLTRFLPFLKYKPLDKDKRLF